MKVSIIIPVYNEFRTFSKVLERVRRAPLPEGCSKEIIVIDDGSTDGTAQMIAQHIRSGDVIGILYAGKKARYRVVWIRHSGPEQKVQAAVHRFTPDECPWKELVAEEPAGDPRASGNSPEATEQD